MRGMKTFTTWLGTKLWNTYFLDAVKTKKKVVEMETLLKPVFIEMGSFVEEMFIQLQEADEQRREQIRAALKVGAYDKVYDSVVERVIQKQPLSTCCGSPVFMENVGEEDDQIREIFCSQCSKICDIKENK